MVSTILALVWLSLTFIDFLVTRNNGLSHSVIIFNQSMHIGTSLVVRGNQRKAHWEVVKWILPHFKGIFDVGLVYGANTRHTNLFGSMDLDHESDLAIRWSLVFGLVQSLVLNVEKPIVFYDRFCIQKISTKENLKRYIDKVVTHR